MFESCLEKQNQVLAMFANCTNAEDKYCKIIEMGKELPPLKAKDKTPENIVEGCQSTVYLHAYEKEGLIFFETESDALISSGLAALLTRVYSGEPPEAILKCAPGYLEELKLTESLTPNRANGLYSMHLRMQQEALKFMIK